MEPHNPPATQSHTAATVGRQLNLAAKATRNYLDRRLTAAGGGYVVWTVLTALYRGGELIQRELAEMLAIEGPTLTRHLARMEGEGLVVRTASADDRRSTRVALTERGHALHERLAQIVFDGSAQLLQGLEPEEISQLHTLLQRITENCTGAPGPRPAGALASGRPGRGGLG